MKMTKKGQKFLGKFGRVQIGQNYGGFMRVLENAFWENFGEF